MIINFQTVLLVKHCGFWSKVEFFAIWLTFRSRQVRVIVRVRVCRTRNVITRNDFSEDVLYAGSTGIDQVDGLWFHELAHLLSVTGITFVILINSHRRTRNAFSLMRFYIRRIRILSVFLLFLEDLLVKNL